MRWTPFALLLACCPIFGQFSAPENGALFLQEEVARIDITLPMDSFMLMYEDIDYASTHEFEAQFVYTTSAFSDTIPVVGFRLRGNTSLEAEKKNFKISFNTYTDGGDYMGVEKLNLNGEHNDVSLRRSKLSWDLLRSAELPGSRTSYVELYVNEMYMGVYINVEHIDEEFIKKRYGAKVGNLYKCLWPASLQSLGSDPENYKYEVGGRRVYDLKTNTYRDDYRGLAGFIQLLDNASDEELACRIEKVFNVDDYLKIAAFDVLIGNWDGYIFNQNNFYLYEDPHSGRIQYVPYDLDNTWGVDWLGQDWTQKNIYNWNGGGRPLYERLMANETYRQQFTFYIEQWIEDYFNEEWLIQRASVLGELIAPYVEQDLYYTYDYGFQYEDFIQSLDTAWGEHLAYSLSEYVTLRRGTALEQVEDHAPLHVIKEIRDSLMDFDSHLLRVWAEGAPDEVRVLTEIDGEEIEWSMHDDGLHLDGAADDGLFALELTGYTEAMDYHFVSEKAGQELIEPCIGTYTLWFGETEGPLYINELMAANDFAIADEAGEYDDWIELYKAVDATVYLGDYYLTDDLHCPFQWKLPSQFLSTDPFQLIWADKDEEQGPFHADFKLSADGELLALFKKQNGNYRLIDHIEFPMSAPDISYGRIYDGSTPWVFFTEITPDASNGVPVGLSEAEVYQPLVFPNPAVDELFIQGGSFEYIEIYDHTGRKVIDRPLVGTRPVVLKGLDQGIYQIVLFSQFEVSGATLLKINE